MVIHLKKNNISNEEIDFLKLNYPTMAWEDIISGLEQISGKTRSIRSIRYIASEMGLKRKRTRQYTEEEARERKNARQREYIKKAGYVSQQNYIKNKTKAYTFRFTLTTDEDIINKLEITENKLGYIKALIRQDIEENG